jgi:hypothetical protein
VWMAEWCGRFCKDSSAQRRSPNANILAIRVIFAGRLGGNMRIAIPVAVLTLSMAIWAQAQSGPPALCKPCLFYGGDLNPDDVNAAIFPNEDTLSVVALTYGSIHVPKNRIILVEGLLIQTVIEHGNELDPQTASWQIRTNILNGTGGTQVGGGNGYVHMQPTGRQFNGYPEYTIAGKVGPIQLSGGGVPGGTDYWINLLPDCTHRRDTECKDVNYFASNTTQETNSVNGFAQNGDQIVLEGPHESWSLCYDDGYSGTQCGELSFGIMGTVVQ